MMAFDNDIDTAAVAKTIRALLGVIDSTIAGIYFQHRHHLTFGCAIVCVCVCVQEVLQWYIVWMVYCSWRGRERERKCGKSSWRKKEKALLSFFLSFSFLSSLFSTLESSIYSIPVECGNSLAKERERERKKERNRDGRMDGIENPLPVSNSESVLTWLLPLQNLCQDPLHWIEIDQIISTSHAPTYSGTRL